MRIIMKKLIVAAGLPGVGKSHICRTLKKAIRGALYFDSDLFAKNYAAKRKINFIALPKKQQEKQRLIVHKAKLEKIREYFKKYKVILLDTCFDLPKSRALFYKFARKERLNLVIVEVICPENVVKRRILRNRHETERMVGSKQDRWKFYHLAKSKWLPIGKRHIVVDSSKDIKSQLNSILK